MAKDIKNLYDSTIDNLIEYAGSAAADRLFDEMENSIPDNEIVFSNEHNTAIQKIIAQERYKILRKQYKKLRRKLLIAAIIALILLLISVLSVSAIRKKIIEKFIRTTSYSTDIEYSSDDDSLVNEEFAFTVNYVPQGFELKTEYSSKIENHMRYENGKSYFEISKIAAVNEMSFDSENAEVSELTVNESYAVMFVKNNETMITWEKNGYVYWIKSDLDKTEVINIAENIFWKI